jgi:uncharacterized membrane protein YozB (DUF420 family)
VLLPTIDAVLNALSATFLSLGYYFIRQKEVNKHRACMLTAFAFSTAFLVVYLIHHAQVGSVPFQGTGVIRALYFALLVPHVILAASVVPLALVTISRALRGKIPEHRRIARKTLPIWLFVSVSGVTIYWMLYRL